MKKIFILLIAISFKLQAQWTYVYDLNINTFNDVDFVNDSVGFFNSYQFVSGSSGSNWNWRRTNSYGSGWTSIFSSLGHYGTGRLQALKGDTMLMQWSNTGNGGMQKSVNQCQSWSQFVSTWPMYNYSFISSNYGIGIVSSGNSLARISASTMTPIYGFSVAVTSPLCLTSMVKGFVVCNSKTLYMTNDSGFSWNPVLTTNYNQNHICFPSSNFGYIACDSGKIIKTINAGTTWSVVSLPTNSKLKWLSFKNDAIGYCGSENGVVFKTFDYGNTWMAENLPTTNNIIKVIAKNQIVYALDNTYKLYRTSIDSCLIKQSVSLITPSTTVCTNMTMSLSGSPSGGTFSGSGVSGSVFTPPWPPITYYITYSWKDGSKGCTYHDTKPISVAPMGTVFVNVPTTPVCQGNSITFSATGAANYMWNPGGFTGPSVTYTPIANTIYTITGFVSSPSCADTKTFSVLVDPCAGIKEWNESENNIIVSPNPSNEIVSIELTEELTEINFKLFDVSGRELLNETKSTTENKVIVDLANFNSGIYFIELADKEQILGRKKIVKQ